MIQLFYNPGEGTYEVYMNGIKVSNIINIKIDSNSMYIVQATITAGVEIVNEKPGEKE